jgi:hypothetical protein
MTDQQETPGSPRGGDRRGNDRRADDRRRSDRRVPPPPWRRPWAFVAYGVLGALVAVLLLRGGGGDEPATGVETAEVIEAPPAHDVDPAPPPGAGVPAVQARSVGEYERLLADGDAALGRRVHTVLFCGALNPVSVRNVPRVPASVAELADGTGRVPAAECKWGSATGAPDFLLVVPPGMADAFAAAPQVEEGFVRRRRIEAEVEWVGRSDALALRTAGVLREM